MNPPSTRSSTGDRERPTAGGRVDYSGNTRAAEADAIVEWVAWLMDGSIVLPGGWRFGLDPLIGLIPGIGDMIGAAASSVIVLQAHRAGVPKPTLIRMAANIALDATVGAIPFIGDLFDFAFKVNRKNLELYRQARAGTRRTGQDVAFLVALGAALLVVLTLPVLIAAWLISRFF